MHSNAFPYGRHLHFSAALALQLRRVLTEYCVDSGVRYAALLEEGGRLCADAGEDALRDSGETAALAVGAFAALQAVAERLGDDQFEGFFHEGAARQFCLMPVTPAFLLFSVFQKPVRLAVVKFCASKAIDRLRDPLELLTLSGSAMDMLPDTDSKLKPVAREEPAVSIRHPFGITPNAPQDTSPAPHRPAFAPGDWVLGPESDFPKD